MKNRPQIKTERLLLRPFELSDAPKVREMAGEKVIADTTLNIPHPYEKGMAQEWISTHQPKFEAGELVNYAIVLKKTQELIGAIGLTINKRFKRAELGYWIGKQYWNNGYCTEAGHVIIKYGFANLNLHKIVATHLIRNPASGKVMEKLGMTKEGIFKEHVIRWEKFEDLISYGILK